MTDLERAQKYIDSRPGIVFSVDVDSLAALLSAVRADQRAEDAAICGRLRTRFAKDRDVGAGEEMGFMADACRDCAEAIR